MSDSRMDSANWARMIYTLIGASASDPVVNISLLEKSENIILKFKSWCVWLFFLGG